MVQKNTILEYTREGLESKLRNYNASVQISLIPASLVLDAVPIFSVQTRMK